MCAYVPRVCEGQVSFLLPSPWSQGLNLGLQVHWQMLLPADNLTSPCDLFSKLYPRKLIQTKINIWKECLFSLFPSAPRAAIYRSPWEISNISFLSFDLFVALGMNPGLLPGYSLLCHSPVLTVLNQKGRQELSPSLCSLASNLLWSLSFFRNEIKSNIGLTIHI